MNMEVETDSSQAGTKDLNETERSGFREGQDKGRNSEEDALREKQAERYPITMDEVVAYEPQKAMRSQVALPVNHETGALKSALKAGTTKGKKMSAVKKETFRRGAGEQDSSTTSPAPVVLFPENLTTVMRRKDFVFNTVDSEDPTIEVVNQVLGPLLEKCRTLDASFIVRAWREKDTFGEQTMGRIQAVEDFPLVPSK